MVHISELTAMPPKHLFVYVCFDDGYSIERSASYRPRQFQSQLCNSLFFCVRE